MISHDRHDDTSTDYEQFERRQLANDQDRRRPAAADLDSEAVRSLVDELIDDGAVDVEGAAQRLVHRPTGRAFTSRSALAHFHLGWDAATSEIDG